MKFGDSEALGRLQISKKKSHKKAASLRNLLSFIFAKISIALQ